MKFFAFRQFSLFAGILLAILATGCADDAPIDSSEDDAGVQTPDAGVDLEDASEDTGNDDAGGETDAEIDDGLITIPEQPWPVVETGPYNIGYRDGFEVTYEAVGEPGRTFEYVIWYPTRDREGAESRYFSIMRRKEAFSEASVGLEEAAPILIFSHGNGSVAEQSFFMTEFFTSHGWIVVAPSHTGNTISDTEGSIDPRSGAFRPQDITALLDDLENFGDDDPLTPFFSDNVVMTGHSFGGFTTLANAGTGFDVDFALNECETNSNRFCDIFEVEGVEGLMRQGFLDERIDVAIPQTPGGHLIFRELLANIEIPTLLMTGELDRTLSNEEEGDPIWQDLDGPHMRVNLVTGGHFTFSNMCELFGSLVPDDGCGEEFIEFGLAFRIINAYSLAFAQYHLFGTTTGMSLLDGTDQPWSAEVELDHKADHPLAP